MRPVSPSASATALTAACTAASSCAAVFIGHTDIFQHLRVDLQRGGQRTQRLLLGQHDLHHLQAGQDAVTGAGVLGEDDVAALLTADAAAVPGHILVDILVTHGSLGVADALLVKGLVQTKVGHDRGNDGIGQQFAALLHVAAVDVQDVVTGDHIALFVPRRGSGLHRRHRQSPRPDPFPPQTSAGPRCGWSLRSG